MNIFVNSVLFILIPFNDKLYVTTTSHFASIDAAEAVIVALPGAIALTSKISASAALAGVAGIGGGTQAGKTGNSCHDR